MTVQAHDMAYLLSVYISAGGAAYLLSLYISAGGSSLVGVWRS